MTTAPLLGSDREQPIYIEADSVEIDEGSGSSLYQGEVILVQGSTRITADQVSVLQGEQRRQERVVAVGSPVTFRQQEGPAARLVEGRALRIEYDASGDVLVMIGEAELLQGGDTFRSDRIVYDRRRELVRAGASVQGSERVRITIQPQN